MNGLSCGEEIMTIRSAVLIPIDIDYYLIQYQHVTDGQTDGQTDVQLIFITCFSIADARKNRLRFDEVTAMSLVAPIFWNTVYIDSEIRSLYIYRNDYTQNLRINYEHN